MRLCTAKFQDKEIDFRVAVPSKHATLRILVSNVGLPRAPKVAAGVERGLASRAPLQFNGWDKLARDLGMLRLSKSHLHPASQPGKVSHDRNTQE
jgi:hypothetical protein